MSIQRLLDIAPSFTSDPLVQGCCPDRLDYSAYVQIDRAPRSLIQEAGQQAVGVFSVAAGRDDPVKHMLILINCSSEPVPLASNGDYTLNKMPDVATACCPALRAASVVGSELQCPRCTSP